MKDIKKLFKMYEDIGGYKSIVRFKVFVGRKCKNKKVMSMFEKLVEKFEENRRLNDYRIDGSYLNFRDFVFSL